MTDLQRKASALLALATNFGKTMPQPLTEMWLKLLEPYTPDEVEGAVRQVIERYVYKTIPPFAELKKWLPKRGTEALEPADAKALAAEAEWSHLLNAIQTHGYYDEPLLHPTTAQVVTDMGGWSIVCQWPVDKLEWKRKSFIEEWIRADGNLDLLQGGAAAIERRQAQAALGADDHKALRKITRDSVARLKQRMLDDDEVVK